LWKSMLAIFSFREAYQQFKLGNFSLFLKSLWLSVYTSPYFVFKWVNFKLKFFFINIFV